MQPPEGADEISVHTFSGGGRVRGRTTDNSGHAEMRLKEFLDARPAWTSRITRVELSIDFSPCRLCAAQRETLHQLRGLLTGIQTNEDALLSWDTFYDDRHIGTRPEDITHLQNDWTISGPTPGSDEAKTQYTVTAPGT